MYGWLVDWLVRRKAHEEGYNITGFACKNTPTDGAETAELRTRSFNNRRVLYVRIRTYEGKEERRTLLFIYFIFWVR